MFEMLAGRQRHSLALFQFERLIIPRVAEPNLGATQVLQNGDLRLQLLFRDANILQNFQVLGMGSMRKVQAKDRGPRFDQLLDRLHGTRGRP